MGNLKTAFVATVLSLIILASAGRSQAQTIFSQTVGSVGEVVLTSREIQMSMLISKAIGDRRAQGYSDADLLVGSGKFSQAVGQVLLDQVFIREGDGFSFSEVNSDELKAAKQKISSLGKNPLWLKINPSHSEIERVLFRVLKASSFFRFKLDTFRGSVSDAEVNAYYDLNKSKFGVGGVETFRENIRMFLIRQQTQERMKAWFEIIKVKHKVKNFMMSKYE